jgi:hypothetical protein
MIMRMLSAGGIAPLSDSLRRADEDNPLGYFELEAVKRTREDPSWLANAPGKAVKVIHQLLTDLPPTYRYAILFIHRDIDEVLSSQRRMLERSGRSGAALPQEALKKVFAAQIQAARAWIASQANCSSLDLNYHEVVGDPAGQARRIAEFLGITEKAHAMAAAVDPTLYRNRLREPGTGPAS